MIRSMQGTGYTECLCTKHVYLKIKHNTKRPITYLLLSSKRHWRNTTSVKAYMRQYPSFSFSWTKNNLILPTGLWRKPPRKVSYKRTFGTPDQGQMLEVQESQTTESALRWWTRHITPSHSWSYSWSYSWTCAWDKERDIINPGSCSNSLSLPRN